MRSVEQPPIVRSDLDTAFSHVKTLANQAKESTDSLGHALIAAKERCPHGEWKERLKKAGVGVRTAQLLMARTRNQKRNDCAFELCEEPSETDEPERDTSDMTNPSQAMMETVVDVPSPKAQPVPPPPDTYKHCRNCRISTPRPGCKDCKELNKPPSREPGDDTGNINPKTIGPKPGAIVFDTKAFAKAVAAPVQMLLIVARAAGMVDAKGTIQETPELEAFRRRSDDLRVDAEAWAKSVMKTIKE